jgi:sugar phosphate isomerase/epimerase
LWQKTCQVLTAWQTLGTGKNLAGLGGRGKMPNPIAFSTLACGEWSRETVIERAAAFGYDGVEWRGGTDGHVSPELPAAERQSLRRRVEEAGLISLAVTAYSRFVSPEPAEIAEPLDHLRQHLDLAADLGASYVRTFLGQLPSGRTAQEAAPAICDNLLAAAEYAAPLGVIVAAESHDDWVRSAALAEILAAVPHPALRALWDFGNAFAAGEDPLDGLRLIGPWLGYVHVKDGLLQGGEWRLMQLGQGQLPLKSIIQGLLAMGYTGSLTVEWERAWHPELEPAETALPAALAALRQWLSEEQTTP